MLDIFAKRQVDGSTTCTASCSADRYGIEQLEVSLLSFQFLGLALKVFHSCFFLDLRC
jgi:hypothetical protein